MTSDVSDLEATLEMKVFLLNPKQWILLIVWILFRNLHVQDVHQP